MNNQYKNVVDTIRGMTFNGPKDLLIFEGIPCEVDPNITSQDLRRAIIQHCKNSSDQLREYQL